MEKRIEKQILDYALEPKNHEAFAQLLTQILPTYTQWTWGKPGIYRKFFALWQQAGFNLSPNHYYSPVPDLQQLNKHNLSRHASMVGIDLHIEAQKQLLESFVCSYRQEYGEFNHTTPNWDGNFYFNNGTFERVDAEILYCMVRHFRPKRIIEIGAGFSTLISAAACRQNASEGHKCNFLAIEPYPNDLFEHPIPGLSQLKKCPLQDVDPSVFSELQANDILFIDSSHVIKCGNDVEYEYFEIIPRLPKGALLHIHDIFLPLGYPENWLKEEHVFWNEQYLFQAFLSFNTAFKVIWAGCSMHLNYPDLLVRAFPGYDPQRVLPGSFWIQRVQ